MAVKIRLLRFFVPVSGQLIIPGDDLPAVGIIDLMLLRMGVAGVAYGKMRPRFLGNQNRQTCFTAEFLSIR